MLRKVESMSVNEPENTRIESDSMGEIEVPADRYWGTQTQRALTHFAIGDDLIPNEIIKTLAVIEKAPVKIGSQENPPAIRDQSPCGWRFLNWL